MTSGFAGFGFAAPLARALDAAGFTTPTPIQAQAIPHLIAGRDLLGLAQTGTGKTAAFVLPILHLLRPLGDRAAPRTARALVLAPTRELAIQIHETVATLAKGQHFSSAVVFGGVSINPQIAALARGVDILVATPGRLGDLLRQKAVSLSAVRHFVLDEADRMLDMGFIRDVRRIVPLLPKERQSMLFSATMPEAIGEIAGGLLRDPAQVEARPEAVPVERIAQHVAHVQQNAKRDALLALVSPRDVTRALVFARTKHGANRVADFLEDYGCEVAAIHGNKSQGARQRALASFKSGETRILVATDIAARGIDVADVSHVINLDLPDEPESYVHRIGRTARAGREGVAITLCDPSERDKLRAVERLIKRAIPRMTIDGVPDGGREKSGARPSHGAERRSSRADARREPAREARPERGANANAPRGRRGGDLNRGFEGASAPRFLERGQPRHAAHRAEAPMRDQRSQGGRDVAREGAEKSRRNRRFRKPGAVAR